MALLPNPFAARPFTSENDLSGIIVSSASPDFTPGDHVFGFVDVPLQWKTRQGSLGHYVHMPASRLAPLPSNVSFTQAAGCTMAGLTAYESLIHQAKLEEGQCIFVNGGSSSVGAFAIQIAKSKGCKVYASASGKNEGFVRGLGADEVGDKTFYPIPSPLIDLHFSS
jgi:NADPH:quinone reductase-like Zn-dependent oxidoreductase